MFLRVYVHSWKTFFNCDLNMPGTTTRSALANWYNSVYQFWRSICFKVEVVFCIIPCGLMHHTICLKEIPYIRNTVNLCIIIIWNTWFTKCWHWRRFKLGYGMPALIITDISDPLSMLKFTYHRNVHGNQTQKGHTGDLALRNEWMGLQCT